MSPNKKKDVYSKKKPIIGAEIPEIPEKIPMPNLRIFNTPPKKPSSNIKVKKKKKAPDSNIINQAKEDPGFGKHGNK